MLKTKFCDLFGIEYPIVCAGMGSVALANLAAAVSEAGGLGTIALAGFSADAIAAEIAAARKITAKPIVVNLLVPFLRPGIFEALARLPVSAVTMFWGDPAEHIPSCKALGLKVIWQCGSALEARRGETRRRRRDHRARLRGRRPRPRRRDHVRARTRSARRDRRLADARGRRNQ